MIVNIILLIPLIGAIILHYKQEKYKTALFLTAISTFILCNILYQAHIYTIH